MTNETQNTNPVTTKPRRWFRFGLRTLLVIVTLLSAPLGWVGWELDQRRKEKKVVAWIHEMGGKTNIRLSVDERSWSEKWTDKWFGEKVYTVSFLHPGVTGQARLKDLKYEEYLNLGNTRVSDLSPLAGLKHLKELILYNAQVRRKKRGQVQLRTNSAEFVGLGGCPEQHARLPAEWFTVVFEEHPREVRNGSSVPPRSWGSRLH